LRMYLGSFVTSSSSTAAPIKCTDAIGVLFLFKIPFFSKLSNY
jgi:hypothetical protein